MRTKNKRNVFVAIRKIVSFGSFFFIVLSFVMGCSSTEIIESPKTTYIVDLNKEYNPVILWTSRDLKAPFDYLGQITARSWQYEGAIERLLEAGKTMGADAIIDIHYEREGFLNIMQAFAVKFK